jgi:hypothetical protein
MQREDRLEDNQRRGDDAFLSSFDPQQQIPRAFGLCLILRRSRLGQEPK